MTAFISLPTSLVMRLVHMTAKRFAITAAALCCSLIVFVGSVRASDEDANLISANIRARHMPFGTILDPIFAAPDSDEIIGYTHCGDSAIWTGHYLAAEAFHYKATGHPDALDSVRVALSG